MMDYTFRLKALSPISQKEFASIRQQSHLFYQQEFRAMPSCSYYCIHYNCSNPAIQQQLCSFLMAQHLPSAAEDFNFYKGTVFCEVSEKSVEFEFLVFITYYPPLYHIPKLDWTSLMRGKEEGVLF